MSECCFRLNRDGPLRPLEMSGVNLALKVDVDTWVGTREGVPRLRDVLEARGLRASFFLSLGPDHSGRAVFRCLPGRGF